MFRGQTPPVSGQGRQQRPERSNLWLVKHRPQRLAFGKGEMPHQRLRIDNWPFPVRQDPTIPIDVGDTDFRVRGNKDRASQQNGSGDFGRQLAQVPVVGGRPSICLRLRPDAAL
jgi:hypothetical protein